MISSSRDRNGDDNAEGESTELLDHLLVLLELAEILSGLEVKTSLLGLIAVKLVTEDADLHPARCIMSEICGDGSEMREITASDYTYLGRAT